MLPPANLLLPRGHAPLSPFPSRLLLMPMTRVQGVPLLQAPHTHLGLPPTLWRSSIRHYHRSLYPLTCLVISQALLSRMNFGPRLLRWLMNSTQTFAALPTSSFLWTLISSPMRTCPSQLMLWLNQSQLSPWWSTSALAPDMAQMAPSSAHLTGFGLPTISWRPFFVVPSTPRCSVTT